MLHKTLSRAPFLRALIISTAALSAALTSADIARGVISTTVSPVAWPVTQYNQLTGESRFSREAISADNRYVVFTSTASNLVVGDSSDSSDVFVKDLLDGSIELVSRPNGSTTTFSNGYCDDAVISSDGKRVAFTSDATDLAPEDASADLDVFVRDLETNETMVVSLADGGATTSADENAYLPSIDADGSHVAFYSNADNLSASDNNAVANIYVRAIAANTTAVASLTDSDANPTTSANEVTPSLSANGNRVAFSHTAQLVDFAAGGDQLYMRDISAGTTTWVSAPAVSAPSPTYGANYDVAISADGNELAFTSESEGFDPLHADLPNGRIHVYRRTVGTGMTQLASIAPTTDAQQPYLDRDTVYPSISNDGEVIGFGNSVEEGEDIFQRSLYTDNVGQPAKLTAVPVPGYTVSNNTSGASVSPNGDAILFGASLASHNQGDTGQVVYPGDIFIRGAGGGMPVITPPPPPPQSPPAQATPPTVTGAKLSKKKFRAGKKLGATLKLTTSEPGSLTATYFKGKKKKGSVTIKLGSGAVQARVRGVVKGKKLKPGSYKLKLSFKSSLTGLTSSSVTLSLTIRK